MVLLVLWRQRPKAGGGGASAGRRVGRRTGAWRRLGRYGAARASTGQTVKPLMGPPALDSGQGSLGSLLPVACPRGAAVGRHPARISPRTMRGCRDRRQVAVNPSSPSPGYHKHTCSIVRINYTARYYGSRACRSAVISRVKVHGAGGRASQARGPRRRRVHVPRRQADGGGRAVHDRPAQGLPLRRLAAGTPGGDRESTCVSIKPASSAGAQSGEAGGTRRSRR